MKVLGRILLALVAVVLLVAGYRYLTAPRPDDATLRRLTAGDLVGFRHDSGAFAWLGVPFASPPVGDLRWRAPRPPEPWTGVREALEHPPFCPQIVPFAWMKPRVVLGEEDCLYLNVWSPPMDAADAAERRLPVMVWIHGGANVVGGSSAADPYRFAAEQNVVVVSLQYRLGLLGWLSHPALRATAAEPMDRSANFALLDMIAALRWVRDNIDRFGGDPGNVTIFGQSAGGFQVFALLASPPASGLFHRAIAQSGTLATVPQARAENYRDDPQPGAHYSAREYVNRLLVSDGSAGDREAARRAQDAMEPAQLADYLRGRPVQALFEAVERRPGVGYYVAANVRDGISLPRESLMEAFADPADYNAVPLILGSNRDEYKLFLWNDERFTERRFGLLPRLRDPEAYDRFTGYFSDQWRVSGVNEPAAVLADSQPGQVWAYRFDWDEQPTRWGVDMSRLFGAAHGIEVAFLFGREAVSSLPLFAMVEDPASWQGLSDAMLAYWASFARTGDPGTGGGGLPRWTPWGEQGQTKLLLDSARDGGVRMSDEDLRAADLKARVREDPALETLRARCERYAQLFLLGFSRDFWDPDEYRELGCGEFPAEDFRYVL